MVQWLVCDLSNFWIVSYRASQNIVVEKISYLSSVSILLLSMDGVNLVITWNKEIPRLMTQMFMLVICCLWVTGIYFLGHLLDLMLSIHQNTWRAMSNAQSSCLRQSSSWGNSVAEPRGVSRCLGSKHGHPRLSLARKCLGALDKAPVPQCQRQLLSPAPLQTFHQCCSLDMLTYQTSWMPAFQHSLICHLSQGELFLSIPALPSWWDTAAK